MSSEGIAKVQHYVPQFLLRKFGNGKKDQLHVFDKQTGRIFSANAKNVASESRFYDFHIGGVMGTMEPLLSKLESSAKPIFDKALDKDSLRVLNEEDRAQICVFFAVQFTRTKAFREQWRSLPQMLSEKLRAAASTPEALESLKEYITPPDENQIKIETARMMISAPKDYGPYFANKTWHLLATSNKEPFFIGDNPLALQNMIEDKPFGNLGLAVPGIEIYFPLSPTRALAMWCPSHMENILRRAAQVREYRITAPHLVETHIRDPDGLEAMAQRLISGEPIPYAAENVRNFNSLQVGSAERFVFSSAKDFTLPEEMIKAHSSIRGGRRIKFK